MAATSGCTCRIHIQRRRHSDVASACRPRSRAAARSGARREYCRLVRQPQRIPFQAGVVVPKRNSERAPPPRHVPTREARRCEASGARVAMSAKARHRWRFSPSWASLPSRPPFPRTFALPWRDDRRGEEQQTKSQPGSKKPPYHVTGHVTRGEGREPERGVPPSTRQARRTAGRYASRRAAGTSACTCPILIRRRRRRRAYVRGAARAWQWDV
jgi:hypothetical protein